MQRTWPDPSWLREPRLASLARLLARARRRSLLLLLLRGSMWALVATGIAYTLSVLLSPPTLSPALLAAPVLAVALALNIALAVRRTPTLLQLARRADHRFDLGERTSTALEMAMRPSRSAHVAALSSALIDDAARHAARIEPRSLAALRPTRALWLLALVALLVVGVQLALPTLSAWRSPPLPEVETRLGALDRETLLADVRRAADLMGLEAEQRRDPYIQAVADAFLELGERIEGGTIDSAEVEAELDRLLEHAARAFDLGLPPELATVPLPVPETAGGANPEAASPPAATEGAAAPTGAELPPALGDLLAALEHSDQERQARAASDALAAELGYASEIMRDSAQREQLLAAAAENGQIVGAAQQSQQGPGPIGGEGTEALEGDAEPPPLFGAETDLDEVVLPGAAPDAGDRVEVTLTPETAPIETVADDPVTPAVAAPSREAALRHDQLSPRDLEVARRYFASSSVGDPSEGAGAGP